MEWKSWFYEQWLNIIRIHTSRYAIDPDEKAVAAFQECIPTALNNIQVVTSVKEECLECVFNDEEVHAVFVCSTTGSHYEIVKHAIEGGEFAE